MSPSTRLPAPGRVRPRDKPPRYTPAWVKWANLHQEIQDNYVVKEMSLNDLMSHMSSKHNFCATKSQWKKQLSRWKMKRNLNPIDAAHALRLYKEAEAAGIQRTVFCSSAEKPRETITSYISKSEKFSSEDELLAPIDGTPTPAHITFQDNDERPRTPPRSLAYCFAPQTSPGNTSPWTTADSGPLSPEQSLLHTPGSCRLSNASSYASLSIGDIDFAETSQAQQGMDPEADLPYAPDDLVDKTTKHVDRNAREYGLGRILTPSTMSSTHVVDQILARESDFCFAQPDELMYGLVSGTPIVVGQDLFSSDGYSAMEQVPGTFRIADIARNNVNGSHFRRPNDHDTFLGHCFGFCICQGQGVSDDAEKMLATALSSFENMVIQQNDHILTSLNVLVATLEAHGQLFVPIIVLESALNIARRHSDAPLVWTVEFMLSVAKRDKKDSNINVEVLRRAHAQFAIRFEESSKMALTSRYNLAWALTQQSLYTEALNILAPLEGQCKVLFGFGHVTTSCTSATLARVYFRLKQPKNAEAVIADLIKRLEERLPRFHPYRLEALGRQAMFLEDLGETSKAEIILRQVTRDRFAVLGPDNPRSRSGFVQLQRILRKRGHEHEIEGLYQQFLNEVNHEYENARWRAY